MTDVWNPEKFDATLAMCLMRYAEHESLLKRRVNRNQPFRSGGFYCHCCKRVVSDVDHGGTLWIPMHHERLVVELCQQCLLFLDE